MPRIGGFSYSSVPRPGAPFNLLRRPLRPFFDGGGIALLTGDDINLVDLDLARQDDRRSFGGQPFAQLHRHLLRVIFIHAQLFCNLSVREFQPP
jgi:hypothetical protein